MLSDKRGSVFVWVMLIIVIIVVLVFAVFYFRTGETSSDKAMRELVLLTERYDAASCFHSEVGEFSEAEDYIEFKVDVNFVAFDRLIENSLIYKYDKNEEKFVSVISGEPAEGERAVSLEEWVNGIELTEEAKEKSGVPCPGN